MKTKNNFWFSLYIYHRLAVVAMSTATEAVTITTKAVAPWAKERCCNRSDNSSASSRIDYERRSEAKGIAEATEATEAITIATAEATMMTMMTTSHCTSS
jgi:hypothetical protein